MRWYLESLAMLLTLMGSGVLSGALIMAWLPARMQPAARVFLSASLGLALLTLVTTLLGWIGHGYAHSHCALVTAVLSAAGAWVGRGWLRRAGGDLVRLAAFGVVASYPILGSLLCRGTFNSYNDTFIYLSHAQWLQGHGFAVAADTGGGHPAWGEVVVFQETNLRMGASFLLGWVQAAFGAEWPHEVYPAVAALGLVGGALAVGAAVLAACPGRWVEAWLAALAAAVTVNGFAFGATAGFLPQTWGLAFAAAAFGLRASELGTRAGRSGCGPWCTGVPIGVCAAASMHCYWDLLPLEGPALALSYLWPWPGRDREAWHRAGRWALAPALTCGLLVNLEWVRAAKGILMNVRAVVANPVAWPAWHFPAHALGLKSSVWEHSRWITESVPPWVMLAGCAVVTGWLAVMACSLHAAGWRHALRPSRRLPRWRGETLIPILIWVVLSAGLFVYFRYGVESPWREHPSRQWADGVGQSWSQYKLMTWGSLAMIGLAAALATGCGMQTRSLRARAVAAGVLAAWCGTGFGWNLGLAWNRGNALNKDTGARRDPFAVCLAVRQKLAAVPPDAWIYLDWPPGKAAKFREVVVYFLHDRALASDWSNDAAIRPHIHPAEAKRTAADCDWVLRYQRPRAGSTASLTAWPIGGMSLERVER